MKEFSKEEIEQFKKDLYDELIKMGEKEKDAREICYTVENNKDDDEGCWISVMRYNTPKEYAELLTM